MLRIRIRLDFTTLRTLLLIPALVQHSSYAGFIRLVWADNILWCSALPSIYFLTAHSGGSNLLFLLLALYYGYSVATPIYLSPVSYTHLTLPTIYSV